MARSALPRTKRAIGPSAASRSIVSTGIGPAATSPPTTIRSTPSAATSARTASSAGRLPWMS
jgi:hypothetical protein